MIITVSEAWVWAETAFHPYMLYVFANRSNHFRMNGQAPAL